MLYVKHLVIEVMMLYTWQVTTFFRVMCITTYCSAKIHYGFRGVVVITSALHAEGREFEPRRNLVILLPNLAFLMFLRTESAQNFLFYCS